MIPSFESLAHAHVTKLINQLVLVFLEMRTLENGYAAKTPYNLAKHKYLIDLGIAVRTQSKQRRFAG